MVDVREFQVEPQVVSAKITALWVVSWGLSTCLFARLLACSLAWPSCVSFLNVNGRNVLVRAGLARQRDTQDLHLQASLAEKLVEHVIHQNR